MKSDPERIESVLPNPNHDFVTLEVHDEYLVRGSDGVFYKGLLVRSWGRISHVVWTRANVPANEVTQ